MDEAKNTLPSGSNIQVIAGAGSTFESGVAAAVTGQSADSVRLAIIAHGRMDGTGLRVEPNLVVRPDKLAELIVKGIKKTHHNAKTRNLEVALDACGTAVNTEGPPDLKPRGSFAEKTAKELSSRLPGVRVKVSGNAGSPFGDDPNRGRVAPYNHALVLQELKNAQISPDKNGIMDVIATANSFANQNTPGSLTKLANQNSKKGGSGKDEHVFSSVEEEKLFGQHRNAIIGIVEKLQSLSVDSHHVFTTDSGGDVLWTPENGDPVVPQDEQSFTRNLPPEGESHTDGRVTQWANDATTPNPVTQQEQVLFTLELADKSQEALKTLQLHLPNEGKWIPLLSSMQDKDSSSNYRLTFINQDNPQQTHVITTQDSHIWDFVTAYAKQLNTLTSRYRYDSKRFVRTEHTAIEENHIDGLNAAFTVKAVLDWFAERNRGPGKDRGVSETLETALRIHTYIAMAQMAQGTVNDINQIIALCKAALSTEQTLVTGLTTALSSLGGKLNAGVGAALSLGSIVLDSYELAHAQNSTQTALFGTQLAFDSTGLVLSVIETGAAISGASAVASVVSGIGVIFAGLGISINALVQSYSAVADDAIAVGNYFANLDKAYQNGGYQRITANGMTTIEPIAGAVVERIDLRQKQFILGSQFLYRTLHGNTGSGKHNYIGWVGDMPKPVIDKTQAINVRQGIGYTDPQVKFTLGDDEILILPSTLISYINYTYESLPGATTRHDRGFDVLRRLEADERFDYDFYIWPSEQIVRSIQQEYVATTVEVLLDDKSRIIVMPIFSTELQGKMTYQLTGNSGEYQIHLQQGAFLRLQASEAAEQTKWILDARHFAGELRFDPRWTNGFYVGDCWVYASDKTGSMTVLTQTGTTLIDSIAGQRFALQEVNADNYVNLQSLHERLSQATRALQTNEWITVENYKPNGSTVSVGRAFYQSSRDRFIYTNLLDNDYRDDGINWLNHAKLAKVTDTHAWFYRDAMLWKVEIATGEVVKQYIPIYYDEDDDKLDSVVSASHAWSVEDMLYFSVTRHLQGYDVQYLYQVTEDTCELVSISGDEFYIDKLHALAKQQTTYNRCFADTIDYSTGTEVLGGNRIRGVVASILHVTHQQNGNGEHFWVRKQDGDEYVYVRANMSQTLPDLMLAAITKNGDQEGYYFFSQKTNKLYFQANTGWTGPQAHDVMIDNVAAVFAQGANYFAQTTTNTFWSLDNQGQGQLVGVTKEWVKTKRTELSIALKTLAQTTSCKAASLVLVGLQEAPNKPLTAWYDIEQDKLILGSSHLSNAVNYLGLNPAKTHAWLFDTVTNTLYLQALLTQPLNLTDALTPVTLPDTALAYQAFPPGQTLTTIRRQDDALLLVTAQGAVLQLTLSATLDTKPSLIAWQSTMLDTDRLSVQIQLLLRDVVSATAAVPLLIPQQAPTWFNIEDNKIVQANGIDQHHRPYFLGKAAYQDAYYCYASETNNLYLVTDNRATVTGNYDFMHVDKQNGIVSLLVSSTNSVKDITPPLLKNIPVLLLSIASNQSRLILNDATMTKYPQIHLRETGKNTTIYYDISSQDSMLFRASLHGNDLLLRSGQHEGSSLLIKDAKQAADNGLQLLLQPDTPLVLKDVLSALQTQTTLDIIAGQGPLNADNTRSNAWLLGNEHNNQLSGGCCDNWLDGRLGDDNYTISPGHGQSTIIDSGGNDTLHFGDGITLAMLQFVKKEQDLHIRINDQQTTQPIQAHTRQQVILSNYYVMEQRIEQLAVEGKYLNFTDITQLIESMAQHTPENVIHNAPVKSFIASGALFGRVHPGPLKNET